MKKYVVYQKDHKDKKWYIKHIASTKEGADEYIGTSLQLALRDCDYATVKEDFKIKYEGVYRKWMIVHHDKHGKLVGYYGGRGIHIISNKLMPMWYDRNDSWAWRFYDKADAKAEIKTLRKEVRGPVKLVKLPRKEWIYKEVM